MNDGPPAVAPVAVADARAVYKRLFRYAKPHWKMFSIGGLGALIATYGRLRARAEAADLP